MTDLAGMYRYAAAAFLAAGALVAAEMPATEPPVAEERFEDWRRVCVAEACRIEVSIASPDASAAELLGLSVEAADREALVVRTPLPLHLPDGVMLTLGGGEPEEAPWRTCDAAGCDARLPLTGSLLRGLRGERGAAVAFTLVDGERVRIAVSLMGFSAALRSLDAASEPER